MKFKLKYPDIKADATMAELEGCLIKTGRFFACDTGLGGCGQVTDWLNINFDVHVCSDECLAKMDQQARDALETLDIAPQARVLVGSLEIAVDPDEL